MKYYRLSEILADNNRGIETKLNNILYYMYGQHLVFSITSDCNFVTVTDCSAHLWLVCTICASRAIVRTQPAVFHTPPRPSLLSSSAWVWLRPRPASTHTAASLWSQKRSTCRKWQTHTSVSSSFFFFFDSQSSPRFTHAPVPVSAWVLLFKCTCTRA